MKINAAIIKVLELNQRDISIQNRLQKMIYSYCNTYLTAILNVKNSDKLLTIKVRNKNV